MSKITELKERRGAIIKNMRSLLDKADEESRDLIADEQKTYDDYEKEVDSFNAQIKRHEDLERIESEARNSRDSDYRPNPSDKKESGGYRGREDYRNAFFDGYARRGKNGMDPVHTNALQVGTDSEGGYIVPEEFETEVVRLLDLGNPIRQAANVIRTASDRNIPVETDDGSFGWIAEEGAYGTDDPAFGRVTLGSYKEGGIVKVSEELLQDSFFDISAYLTELAARRYNNLEDSAFGNGNGTGKPTGLFATTAVGGVNLTGFQGATSATAVIASNDLIDTFHALKRVYRARATWVTSDTLVKMIRKLKDSDGQYIWQPGLTAEQPDRILGRPVIVTEGHPTVAAEAKSIMFGDLSQYYIADRIGMVMKRLNELYAANGQIGFQFMRRVDAKLVDPKAFTYFQHGAAA